MKKIPAGFYRRDNVLQVAEELIGKLLVTNWGGELTSGRIVECEAYAGPGDMASHASGGRRTKRNEPMYARGGICYVYLCYGIHHLFNVVTHDKDIPQAVLIRSLEPIDGIPVMLNRTRREKLEPAITKGPGNLCKALGIFTQHSGLSLNGHEIFLAEDGFHYPAEQIMTSPRIGVDYAGVDALLPYRYYVKGNPYVSGKPR